MSLHGVFLDTDTVDGGDLDMSPIEHVSEIEWRCFGTTPAAEVAARIDGCDVVITNKVVLDRRTIMEAGALRLIVIAATGTNNVDLAAAAERGVPVCNVSGYGTPSIVQHVFTLILALSTQLPRYMEAVAAGRWQEHPHFCLFDFPIRELDGLTLGIVGYGILGKGVADAASAFGLNVKISQRPGGETRPERVPLTELLPEVDILSLHCPLNDHTRNLIGRRELALMKNDALLINTARGGVVNERALADALRAGELGGAGVDVLTQEPPVDGNVLLANDIPRLIVTPHIAWASRASRQRVINIVGDNVAAYLGGAPVNRVA